MIAMLTALLGAAMGSQCLPVPGSERIFKPSTRWVIVGELHGTNETPAAFANLICLAAATGRPVAVALEYSADGQAIIDAYLASDGNGRARSALLRLPLFTSEMQDGRGSVAFLRLWDRLRLLKRTGRIQGVIASDVGRLTPPGQERDASMAQTWSTIRAPADGIVLALVGNLHAMRKPIVFPDRSIIPAGSLMPPKQTITINVVGGGGTAWNCQDDGCRAHDNGSPGNSAPGITILTGEERQWDASYELGVPTIAAAPAIGASKPQ